VAVDTPGHAPGHVTLIVFGDAAMYFLAGDSFYVQENLDNEAPDGSTDDPKGSVETLRRIKRFAMDREVVILPAHDHRAPDNLANSVIYRPAPLK